jgi:hypothetical protein
MVSVACRKERSKLRFYNKSPLHHHACRSSSPQNLSDVGQTVIASPLVYPHAFKRPSIAFVSQKSCKGDKLARHTPTGRGL